MEFLSFVYLVIISVVVSLALIKLKGKLSGGILTEIIIAYIGARLGSVLFGSWAFLTFSNVSIIPAILGAIIAILLATSSADLCKK